MTRGLGDVGSVGEVACVRGDSIVVSGADGDVRRGSRDGLYLRDIRFLDRLELRVDGRPPRPLAGVPTGGSTATFHGWVADVDAPVAEPTLLVTRRRRVDGGLREHVTLENRSDAVRHTVVELACGTDFAYVFDVRSARELPAAAPSASRPGQLRFDRGGGSESTVVSAEPSPEVRGETLRWRVEVPPRAAVELDVAVSLRDAEATASPPVEVRPAPLDDDRPSVRCSDPRVDALVERSLGDLAALELRDDATGGAFYGAGAPWYLTLFGRDSLWSAFMMLPFDRTVAGGTLRTLAHRQGRRQDPETEEEPGKIPHELRRGPLVDRGDLPPTYYGTVDATPLFVVLLHEAWYWGLAEEELVALATPMERALGWMAAAVESSADGLIAYRRRGERGLDNQGWKDSPDALQFRDGGLARPPVALVEVQAYAYDAARRGAAVLRHLGRGDPDGWDAWAEELRGRVQDRFWVGDGEGGYLAAAVDGDGRPVDAPASNMGHVLATGLLEPEQARAVAARLGHPSLQSGWGLRTMATTAAGYHPLSYHRGSVWPHDTAIAAWGCGVAGAPGVAGDLVRGLVRAAPAFGYRLPELFAGVGEDETPAPVPYHDACRPQAWSAAAAPLLVRTLLGLRAAVPEGRVVLAPLAPAPFDRLEVRGLRVGGGRLDVIVDAASGCEVELHGANLDIVVA